MQLIIGSSLTEGEIDSINSMAPDLGGYIISAVEYLLADKGEESLSIPNIMGKQVVVAGKDNVAIVHETSWLVLEKDTLNLIRRGKRLNETMR